MENVNEYETTTYQIGNSIVRVHRPKLSEIALEKRKKEVEETLTRVGRAIEERRKRENEVS